MLCSSIDMARAMRPHFAQVLALTITLLLANQARADCVAEPTPACLVGLGLAEVDKLKGTDEFGLNGGNMLTQLGSTQAEIGDVAGAARTGSQIGTEPGLDIRGEPMLDNSAQELLLFVDDVLIKHQPSSTDWTPIRLAAQALLEAASKLATSKRTSSTEAYATQILVRIGAIDEARSALGAAVRRFAKAVDAGDDNILPAADDLTNAALALGDFAKAREIVGMISKERMGKRGVSSNDPGWTNKSAIRSLTESDPANGKASARNLNAAPRSWILDLAALASIRSAEVAEAIKRLDSMHSSGSRKARDPSLSRQFDELNAAAQLEGFAPQGAHDNLKIAIARTLVAVGEDSAAEALAAEIADGGRAAVFIQLALARAGKGKSEEASRLMDEATKAFAAEQDSARLVDFNVGIAVVLLKLNDRRGAEAAINKAHPNLEGIDDPMLQFQEAAGVAAVQLKLGHEDEATATLAKLVGGRPVDLAFGRVLAAEFLTKQGYPADGRALLSRALRDALGGEPIAPLELAGLYLQAAKTLVDDRTSR